GDAYQFGRRGESRRGPQEAGDRPLVRGALLRLVVDERELAPVPGECGALPGAGGGLPLLRVLGGLGDLLVARRGDTPLPAPVRPSGDPGEGRGEIGVVGAVRGEPVSPVGDRPGDSRV